MDPLAMTDNNDMDLKQKPLFETMDLNAIDNSTITNVRLYPYGAQITRVFKLDVGAGQSQVAIWYLPTVIDRQSIRVENRGAAAILGVKNFILDKKTPDRGSPHLQELHRKRSLAARSPYMLLMRDFDEGSPKSPLLSEEDISALDKEIHDEEARQQKKVAIHNDLRIQVIIGLFSEQASENEIELVYDVETGSCGWIPEYDIHIDTQSPPSVPAKVIYKAVIAQRTGETWEDVPIILETKTPKSKGSLQATAGMKVRPWRIKVKPQKIRTSQNTAGGGNMRDRVREVETPESSDEEGDFEYMYPSTCCSAAAQHPHDTINTTFYTPRNVTVATDSQENRVTIEVIHSNANVTCFCIPKENSSAFLRASIKNPSESTLLSGDCNVFIDKGFVAHCQIPETHPKETFECDLGFDPSIRVSYQVTASNLKAIFGGLQKKPFWSKAIITINNTKPIEMTDVKIMDTLPTSKDENIVINLIEPKLTRYSSDSVTSKKPSPVTRVDVSQGVIAQWHSTDDPNCEHDTLGQDGGVDWICTIPAQSTIQAVLEWEVSTKKNVEVEGLYDTQVHPRSRIF